ncbi:mechanosensitive ion channel family protein [candidate division KSB1 bacterium]|nr:mechanosensitive ion channel family protein [candidate division KSB1 bacterium]
MIAFIKNYFFEIAISRYFLALGIILLTLVTRLLFNRLIIKVLKRWAQKTSFKYDDLFIEAIHPPLNAFIMSTGFFLALFILGLPRAPVDMPLFLENTYKVTLSVILVWLVYRLTDLLAYVFKQFILVSNEEFAQQFAELFRQSLRILVLVLGGIMIIQNLGYSVSSLLTGLGIGGLAVALAAQDTLANFFGTIVMVTDRPFKIGDWIQFGNVDGQVESIGFRSTRVRTWSKSMMIIPNKLLTSEIIQNWSLMPKRRVQMTIGITYDSPQASVQLLLTRIREILKNDPAVDSEFYLANFVDFSPSSLDIMIYYFTISTKWAEHLAVRERINLQIISLISEMGLLFAFPSQTVYFGNSLRSTPGTAALTSKAAEY